MSFDEYTTPDAIAALDSPPSASQLTPDTIALHGPDTHLAYAVSGGACEARCSLWWTDCPTHDDQDLGLIGHYAAADAESADALLSEACARLRQAGCTYAVGPMDGATWYTYRFVTGRGERAPFFLEPVHPRSYPTHFADASFSSVAEYVSVDVPDLTTKSAGSSPPVDVELRTLDPTRIDAELARLYDLVTASFADNFLYTPIPREAFVKLYRGLLSVVDPSLVRLAETPEGRLVGIAFLVPDQTQAERGKPVETVIFKTLAVHPEVAGQGLGSWLTAEAHERAAQQGYSQGIHAFIHETNRSRRISRHYGDVIRRYTLFGRSL